MEANELLAVIQREFRDLRTELDVRFQNIDTRLDGMDTRLDGMDTRLNGMDTRMERLESGLRKVSDEVRHAHVLIEELRSDMQVFNEGEASPLAKRVSALEVRVTELERKRRK